MAPILAPGSKEKLWEVLDLSLRDRRQAWVLHSDGLYRQLRPEGDANEPEIIGTQEALMKLTRLRAAEPLSP